MIRLDLDTPVHGSLRPGPPPQTERPGWILVHKAGTAIANGNGEVLVFSSREQAGDFLARYLCDAEDFELKAADNCPHSSPLCTGPGRSGGTRTG